MNKIYIMRRSSKRNKKKYKGRLNINYIVLTPAARQRARQILPIFINRVGAIFAGHGVETRIMPTFDALGWLLRHAKRFNDPAQVLDSQWFILFQLWEDTG